MPKNLLNQKQKDQYLKEGYIFPIPILKNHEVSYLRGKLEDVESKQNGVLRPEQRNKSFLLFRWLNDLVRNPLILGPISQLIGPDILLWNTIFWIKESKTKTFVSWHQDTKYWGLSSKNVLTAWLALSDASIEAGCMRVMPRTHVGDVLSHQDNFDQHNMLTRGQEITSKLDEANAVFMPLKAGEMSIHNYRLAHASGPNLTKDRRIGVSMHFMPTNTKQIIGDWDCATLVKGKDNYKNFAEAPIPSCDLDPSAVMFHERACNEIRKVLYKDATSIPRKL